MKLPGTHFFRGGGIFHMGCLASWVAELVDGFYWPDDWQHVVECPPPSGNNTRRGPMHRWMRLGVSKRSSAFPDDDLMYIEAMTSRSGPVVRVVARTTTKIKACLEAALDERMLCNKIARVEDFYGPTWQFPRNAIITNDVGYLYMFDCFEFSDEHPEIVYPFNVTELLPVEVTPDFVLVQCPQCGYAVEDRKFRKRYKMRKYKPCPHCRPIKRLHPRNTKRS